MRPNSRFLVRTLQACALLALSGCNSCDRLFCWDYSGPTDLKRAPIRSVLNDVSLGYKLYHDPTDGSPADKKDKRLFFQAKKDGAFGFLQLDRDLYGTFDAEVTVGISSTEGLVPGQSFAALEVDSPPDSNPLQFDVVAAAYRPDVNGFLVFSQSEAGPQGTAKLVPNAKQVALGFRQSNTILEIYARPMQGSPPQPIGAEIEIFKKPNIIDQLTKSQLGVGVVQLHKKGGFFVDYPKLRGPDLMGPVEQPLMNGLQEFLETMSILEALLNGPNADLALASNLTETGMSQLEQVASGLQDASDKGQLQESTQASFVAKGLVKGCKELEKLQKDFDADKSSKNKANVKRVVRLRQSAIVLMANLSGYRATSIKHINASLGV